MNKNYILENSSEIKYAADCQLVVSINAYHYLTGNVIEQGSGIYKDLAERAGCAHGSCINVQKAWEKLGIWEDQRFSNEFELKDNLSENCFIEVSTWHQRYGFHSVSLVDYLEKAKCVQVLNFKYETTIHNWIFWEDFQHFLVKNPNHEGWVGRTFKII